MSIPTILKEKEVIKVAMLVPSLKLTGPIIVATDIARICNKQRHIKIEMVSLRGNSDEDLRYTSSLGLSTRELHLGKFPSLRKIRQARSILEKYDLVHVHTFWPTVIAYSITAPKVATVHNDPFQDYVYEYGKVIGNIMAHLSQHLLRKFDRVVSISKYVDSAMKLDNSEVIYNGVEDVANKLPSQNPEDSNYFKIVCVSSLTKRKNIFELLDAIECCVRSGIKIHCKIIGRGVLRDKITQYVSSHKLNTAVTLTGQLEKDSVYSIVRQSDCLVHTSLSEGFGLIVAEAYMLGKLVIVKDIPVMHELVENDHTGYVYTSIGEFAKRITTLHKNKSLKDSMHKKARQYYEENFTDEIMAGRYLKAYCSLSGQSKTLAQSNKQTKDIKFSVLIAVYIKEVPEYFDHALKSITNQNLMPNEIVIVEDGPLSDGLSDVIEKYKKLFPGLINTVKLENNVGLGLALNAGIKQCKYEYIARMDSDDVSLPERCEKQVDYISRHPEVDVVGTNIAEYDESLSIKTSVRVVPKDNEDIKKYIKKRSPFNHMTVMYKKSSVENAGSYMDCLFFEDYYLWCRMYARGGNFHNLQESLVNARCGDSMIARRGGFKYVKSIFNFQKRIYLDNIIGLGYMIFNLSSRLPIALLPSYIRKIFYGAVLRRR
jgi:glycosyltransferase involved in cell wall biosynthesis